MNYNFVGTIASFVSLYKFIPNNLMDENDYSIQKIGVYFPPSLLKNTSKPILADSVLQILGANLISKEIVMKLHELRILKQSLCGVQIRLYGKRARVHS